MQFSVVAVFALFSLAIASPMEDRERRIAVFKRQVATNPNAIQGGPAVNQPAMTDRNGNIIPFRTEGVYKAAVEAGL